MNQRHFGGKVAVVIHLQVLARMSWLRKQAIKCYKGDIILRPGDGLNSFSKDKSANFLVKKKCNEAFRGV